MAERIDSYTPDIPATHWAVIETFVRAAVTDAGPATPYRADMLLGSVTALVRWGWMQGHPVDRAVIFDRWTIEQFIAEGCPPTWSPASRGNRRSVLFRVSEALLGADARTPRLAPLPASDPVAPYTAAELVGFRSWANTQTTPAKRRDSLTVLVLGAGAGLATEDLLPLRAADVNLVDGTWVVTVTGRRNRDVPVLAPWGDDLLDLLVGLNVDDFMFRPRRQNADAKNSVSNFLGKTAGVSKPSPQRLRATWIVHHLTIGTPVKPFMAAAGVQSLEALTRYLPFVPDIDPDVVRRRLRGDLA